MYVPVQMDVDGTVLLIHILLVHITGTARPYDNSFNVKRVVSPTMTIMSHQLIYNKVVP